MYFGQNAKILEGVVKPEFAFFTERHPDATARRESIDIVVESTAAPEDEQVLVRIFQAGIIFFKVIGRVRPFRREIGP